MKKVSTTKKTTRSARTTKKPVVRKNTEFNVKSFCNLLCVGIAWLAIVSAVTLVIVLASNK